MDNVELTPLQVNAIATDTTGDKGTIVVPFKCEVVRAYALVNGASTHATGFVIKFDERPTAGSDTSRGDGDVGVLSKTAATNQQGKYLYEEPSARTTLVEGSQVIVQVTTANGDACVVDAGILVTRVVERPGNNTNMVSA